MGLSEEDEIRRIQMGLPWRVIWRKRAKAWRHRKNTRQQAKEHKEALEKWSKHKKLMDRQNRVQEILWEKAIETANWHHKLQQRQLLVAPETQIQRQLGDIAHGT